MRNALAVFQTAEKKHYSFFYIIRMLVVGMECRASLHSIENLILKTRKRGHSHSDRRFTFLIADPTPDTLDGTLPRIKQVKRE